jgi:hypothetical protein
VRRQCVITFFLNDCKLVEMCGDTHEVVFMVAVVTISALVRIHVIVGIEIYHSHRCIAAVRPIAAIAQRALLGAHGSIAIPFQEIFSCRSVFSCDYT